jgi:hypothetical protein
LTIPENREWFLEIIKRSGIDFSCDSVSRNVTNMLDESYEKAKQIQSDLTLISDINEYFPNELPLFCEEFDSKDYISKLQELRGDIKKLKQACEKDDES